MSTQCCCFGCVDQTGVGVVENLGKYSRLITPGFFVLIPCLENVAAFLNMRVRQLEVNVETKTQDNVFVRVQITVMYRIIPESAVAAHYKLTDPQAQIRSYVSDTVRSSLPRLDLDDAFENKDHLANSCKEALADLMAEYGYEIVVALVTDLDPDRQVKHSMNEINAQQRLREAAFFKAEAEKILQVKAAEAEAESKYLSGLGVARQRRAIVDGLKESVEAFTERVEGTSAADIMDLVLVTQYLDMVRDVGNGTSTLFMGHSPGTIQDLKNDLARMYGASTSS